SRAPARRLHVSSAAIRSTNPAMVQTSSGWGIRKARGEIPMLSRVDDVMLMAYVDGEIDSETAHEIERAIAKDPALARRARAIRDSSPFARPSFPEARHAPVP